MRALPVSRELPDAGLLDVTEHSFVFLNPGVSGPHCVTAMCVRGRTAKGSPLPCGSWSRTTTHDSLGPRTLSEYEAACRVAHTQHAEQARAREAELQAHLRRGSVYDPELYATDYKTPNLGAKRCTRDDAHNRDRIPGGGVTYVRVHDGAVATFPLGLPSPRGVNPIREHPIQET